MLNSKSPQIMKDAVSARATFLTKNKTRLRNSIRQAKRAQRRLCKLGGEFCGKVHNISQTPCSAYHTTTFYRQRRRRNKQSNNDKRRYVDDERGETLETECDHDLRKKREEHRDYRDYETETFQNFA